MFEVWKPIPGCNCKVSNLGRVMGARGQALKQRKSTKGKGILVTIYFTVGSVSWFTDKRGGHKGVYVHRLVALAFIKNPKGLHSVRHKDTNRNHNAVDNLEWGELVGPVGYNNHKGTIDRFNLHRLMNSYINR